MRSWWVRNGLVGLCDAPPIVQQALGVQEESNVVEVPDPEVDEELMLQFMEGYMAELGAERGSSWWTMTSWASCCWRVTSS